MSAFGVFESLIQRSIFLALVVFVGVLQFPLKLPRGAGWLGYAIDAAIVAATLAACGYIVLYADAIMTSLPTAGRLEIGLTIALVLVILELSRRAIGLVFPLLVATGLAYALLGQYIPGRLGHRGFDMEFVTETLLLGDLGFWGSLVGVAATVIAAFTLFGSFLLHTGGGRAFMDLALRVSGRSTGGAAKIATVASSIFGMVSGSSVANVATTGNFTIPLMKRLGYPAGLAGGVEAVASTGGQLAPPIMGAAAFIMAEILGVEYLRIAAAAILPAVLFYLGVFVTTSFWGMALVLALMGFFWSASMPLVEATTLTYLGKHSARYGRIRSWGSVGFIIAVLGLGYAFDYIAIHWLLWAGLFIMLGILFFARQMSRLRQAGVQVVSIRGNHDAASSSNIPSNIPSSASLLIHNSSAQDFKSNAAVMNFANATMLNITSSIVKKTAVTTPVMMAPMSPIWLTKLWVKAFSVAVLVS